MAVRRKTQKQAELDPAAQRLGVIANLLGLLATKDMTDGERVYTLEAAGFSRLEIARLLRKLPNTVTVILSRRQKAEGKSKRKTRK